MAPDHMGGIHSESPFQGGKRQYHSLFCMAQDRDCHCCTKKKGKDNDRLWNDSPMSDLCRRNDNPYPEPYRRGCGIGASRLGKGSRYVCRPYGRVPFKGHPRRHRAPRRKAAGMNDYVVIMRYRGSVQTTVVTGDSKAHAIWTMVSDGAAYPTNPDYTLIKVVKV